MVKKNIRKDKNNIFESLNLNLFNNKSGKKSYNGILIIAGILGALFLMGMVVGWAGDAVESGHKLRDAIRLLNSTNEAYNASFTNANFTFNEGVETVLRFNISALGLKTVPSRNITAINISFDGSFIITNYTFNVSMGNGSSNIFSTFNLTGINDSSPPVYFFNKQYDNGTVNGTLTLIHLNRTNVGVDNRSVFHWLNMSDDYGLLGNGTKGNVPGNNQSFYFRVINNIPGYYNITVLLENDTGAAGATSATANFTIRINDTTAPDKVLLHQNSTGAGSITPIYSAATVPATTSKVNLSSKSQAVTLYISVNAADFNESIEAGRVAYAGQAILNANVSVYNITGGAGVMNSSLIVKGSGTNNATLDINFSAMMGGILNLTDGDYLIVVRNVTDIGGNRNFTSLAYNVTIDGTNPTVTVAKASSSTSKQIVLDLTLSDATSGIAGKQCTTTGGGTQGITMSGNTGTQTATQTDLGCSTDYTYTVACTDHAGNTNSQSVTVKTDACAGGGTSGTGGTGGSGDVVGSASSPFWILTYNEATSDLNGDSDGVSSNLDERYRVKVMIDTKLYYVGVVETTDTTAKINVTTTAEDKEATLSVGDVKKFDVNADNTYDISVTLNGIDSATGKADLNLVYIQEEVPAEEQAEVEEQAGTEGTTTSTAKSKAWIWIVVVLVVLVILGAIFFGKKKSRFKNYGF